jgi:hypothetical protein
MAGRMVQQAEANQAVVSTNAPPTPRQTELERLQAQLLDPKLNPESREILIKKIEILRLEEEQHQAGKKAPAPKGVEPTFETQPQAMAVAEIESGIYNGSEGMIRPSQAQINNYWQGLLEGEVTLVFAGAAADDPEQGLVIVMNVSADSNGDVRFTRITAPSRGGALTVIAEEDGVIRLEAAGGDVLRFSPRSKTFLP